MTTIAPPYHLAGYLTHEEEVKLFRAMKAGRREGHGNK
jgi:hypothetical protein